MRDKGLKGLPLGTLGGPVSKEKNGKDRIQMIASKRQISGEEHLRAGGLATRRMKFRGDEDALSRMFINKDCSFN